MTIAVFSLFIANFQCELNPGCNFDSLCSKTLKIFFSVMQHFLAQEGLFRVLLEFADSTIEKKLRRKFQQKVLTPQKLLLLL